MFGMSPHFPNAIITERENQFLPLYRTIPSSHVWRSVAKLQIPPSISTCFLFHDITQESESNVCGILPSCCTYARKRAFEAIPNELTSKCKTRVFA